MADKLLNVIAKGLGFVPAAVPSAPYGGGGWFPVIREPFSGAWQRNIEVRLETSLSNPTVFRCVTLVAGDIGKLRMTLVAKDPSGVWIESESPAYSPVLRKPNRYQTWQQFAEAWIISKLIHGNTYVLKERDNRGVVVALYILMPLLVKPMVAPDSSVYYQLSADNLAGIEQQVVVPAREIIHDRFNALFHPLCGLSPMYAAGLSATHGTEIATRSILFFKNGAAPGGILTHPEEISDELARQYKSRFEETYGGHNVGRVAVLGNGLAYQPLTQNAVDSQLVEQLKATDERICTAFGVPSFMVGVGAYPSNVNVDALNNAYYSQTLQTLIEAFEGCVDEGLGLPAGLGVQMDLSGLLRMDQATQAKALAELVKGSILSPNEARARLGLKGVKGGESPMAQQQDFSLAALAERDRNKPFATPDPAPNATPATPADDGKAMSERLRPVLESFAAELALRTERQEAALQKRIAKLESAAEATRAQVNQVVKALPKPKPGSEAR